MEKIIKPGFMLNNHNRDDNPLFESHDPSMMWDPISKMYYSYSTDSAIKSKYRQGIPIRKSEDLVSFEFVGYALSDAAIEGGRNNGEFPPTKGFWAPYVEYVSLGEDEKEYEYRMYYSATKEFGSSESKIWLAVSKSPEGPFENRGVVMDTWFTDNTYPNAIDAHVADDYEGRKYFIYGSYFGGIFIKELDAFTGLSKDGNPKSLGKRIAVKPEKSHVDGPEGAAIISNGQYFYLFLSYGWLGDDYDIRVGRSKNILGPYLDYNGNDLDGVSLGTKIAGSYCFAGNRPYALKTEEPWTFGGFRGPGHGVPFYDVKRGEYFFVHHVRDGAKEHRTNISHASGSSYRMHYMVVRRLIFLDGWPVCSPQPFAGEEFSPHEEEIKDSLWEWLVLPFDDNTIANSRTEEIPESLLPVKAVIFNCYDYENSCEGICFCGYTREGIHIWGKKRV